MSKGAKGASKSKAVKMERIIPMYEGGDDEIRVRDDGYSIPHELNVWTRQQIRSNVSQMLTEFRKQIAAAKAKLGSSSRHPIVADIRVEDFNAAVLKAAAAIDISPFAASELFWYAGVTVPLCVREEMEDWSRF